MRHLLFPIDELPAGKMRSVEVAGVSIVVIRSMDGSLHALRNVCSHQGAPLAEGSLSPVVEAEGIGRYRLRVDKQVLRCPWHAYEFELDSGRSLADPEVHRVRSYPVTVSDGIVAVDR
jgi:nitrite reductase (NADH) small subunit